GQSYILRYGGSWTDITRDANSNAPHTDIHAITPAGGSLLVGTDGGIWQYNGRTWSDITGNLADAEINGLASDPTNPTSVFAVGRGISVSQYTGTQVWTQASTPPMGAGSNNDLNGSSVAVDPNNPKIVYEVTQGSPFSPSGRLFSSSDGG